MILPFAGAVDAFMAILANLPFPFVAFIGVNVIFYAIAVAVRLVLS